ncbi:MAG: hypothetical protein WA814_06620 [Candidatus Baltobacteraceae bacterium]
MRLATFALFLGLSGASCTSSLPLAVAGGMGASNCPDATPHTSRFVTIAPIVQLEVSSGSQYFIYHGRIIGSNGMATLI